MSTSILFSYTCVWSQVHCPAPQSLIRLKVIIVVFQDNVSKEKIDKNIADVIANGKDISLGLNLEI